MPYRLSYCEGPTLDCVPHHYPMINNMSISTIHRAGHSAHDQLHPSPLVSKVVFAPFKARANLGVVGATVPSYACPAPTRGSSGFTPAAVHAADEAAGCKGNQKRAGLPRRKQLVPGTLPPCCKVRALADAVSRTPGVLESNLGDHSSGQLPLFHHRMPSPAT